MTSLLASAPLREILRQFFSAIRAMDPFVLKAEIEALQGRAVEIENLQDQASVSGPWLRLRQRCWKVARTGYSATEFIDNKGPTTGNKGSAQIAVVGVCT